MMVVIAKANLTGACGQAICEFQKLDRWSMVPRRNLRFFFDYPLAPGERECARLLPTYASCLGHNGFSEPRLLLCVTSDGLRSKEQCPRAPTCGGRLSALKTPININTTTATPTFRALGSRTSEDR